jgi:hypothetical protein
MKIDPQLQGKFPKVGNPVPFSGQNSDRGEAAVKDNTQWEGAVADLKRELEQVRCEREAERDALRPRHHAEREEVNQLRAAIDAEREGLNRLRAP